MIISAAILPLLSFIISLLISERYSWGVALIAPALMLFATILAGSGMAGCWNEPDVIRIEWFRLHDQVISANLSITRQSLLMLFTVSLVSFLVHVFSIGYMAGDMNQKRYFAMLGFFTFAMQGIVLADNIILLFVFWELVGFASYMLIGHYTESLNAGKSSKKAFVMNRVGDAGFIVGLMIIWTYGGSFEMSEILFPESAAPWRTVAALMIFCGVIGKSAQFPLFTWLPDAMVGPAPVSALIHAATMVAAGVYLMVRIFPIFDAVSLEFVAWTGALTAVTGGLCALWQFDIKRILAYSTISQLGLMIMIIGRGGPDAAFLHLYTHAFFKAGLFLCAGVVIHCLHDAQLRAKIHFDPQDIRNMGGLSGKIRPTFFAALACSASLAGMPLTSGFLSKEAMLGTLWSPTDVNGIFFLLIMMIVSFLTTLYTFRFIWYVFIKPATHEKDVEVLQSPAVMRLPIIVLAGLSCWLVVSGNPFAYEGWVMNGNSEVNAFLLSIAITAFSLFTGWIIFRRRPPVTNPIFGHGMFVDAAYGYLYRKIVLPAGNITNQIDTRAIDKSLHWNAYGQVTLAHVINWVDEKIVDGLVHFIAFIASVTGTFVRSFQKGKIQLYIFWAVFAIIIFLIYALN